MQALVSDGCKFHCSVFRVQKSVSPSGEKEVKKKVIESFLCILSFSKESMRL